MTRLMDFLAATSLHWYNSHQTVSYLGLSLTHGPVIGLGWFIPWMFRGYFALLLYFMDCTECWSIGSEYLGVLWKFYHSNSGLVCGDGHT